MTQPLLSASYGKKGRPVSLRLETLSRIMSPHQKLVAEDFKRSLRELSLEIGKNPHEGRRYRVDWTKHFYWDLPTMFRPHMSGASCAEQIFSGLHDDSYSITRDEIEFISSNSRRIAAHIQQRHPEKNVHIVSLGPGPGTSVQYKELTLAKALGASFKSFTAIDYTERSIHAAAAAVKQDFPNIRFTGQAANFEEPFDLSYIDKNDIVFFTFFGDTIGQYSCAPTQGGEKSDPAHLVKLIRNISNMTPNEMYILATTDDEFIDPDAPGGVFKKYNGIHSHHFATNLFCTAADITGTESFNPDSVIYKPALNKETSSVDFEVIFLDREIFYLDPEPLIIPASTRIIVGCSQKLPAISLSPRFREAGMDTVDIVLPSRTTTDAILTHRAAKSLSGTGLN